MTITLAPPVDEYWKNVDAHLVRYCGTADFVHRIIVKASGAYLYDSEGRKILDWTSGQMSAILGHCHPEIVAAVVASMHTLHHAFSGFVTPPIVEAAAALAALLPPQLQKVLFLSTGGDSNEAAIRMAKLVTGKFEIVAMSASWHGMTQGAGAATFSAGRTVQSCGSLAACIVEPILSSGEVIDLPEGYLKALQTKCKERGLLLIMDEAQTGLGRTGRMFAFEHQGVVPDILTLSKTLGCGLPVSAVITSPEIEQVAHDKGYMFYTTHTSDPLAGAATLAVLDVVVRDNLHVRAKVLGDRIRARFRELQKRFKCIHDIRGKGLLIGLEIVSENDKTQPARELGNAIAERCMELGLSMNVTRHKGAGIFRIAPPLTSSDEEVETGLALLEKAFLTTKGTIW